MNRSASVGIKLALFFVVTLLFVWGLIAYAGAHAKRTTSGASETFSGDRKRIEKTFSLKPGGTFELASDLGDVDVEGWENNQVSFSADIEGNSRFVRDFTITFDTTAEHVIVEGKDGDHGWFFGHWNDVDIHYVVKVPKKCNVNVSTSGGGVNLAAIEGNIRGTTSGGSINANDLTGTTILNTSGGSVDVRNLSGSCEAKTSGGNVRCENVKGPTLAHTSGGNVHLADVEGKIDGSTSGGSVYARMNGANDGVSLRTSGGSITLEVAPTIAADLDASTSGGGVDCDLPITVKGKMDDNELVGKINGGGNTIHLRTSGGSIHIRGTH